MFVRNSLVFEKMDTSFSLAHETKQNNTLLYTHPVLGDVAITVGSAAVTPSVRHTTPPKCNDNAEKHCYNFHPNFLSSLCRVASLTGDGAPSIVGKIALLNPKLNYPSNLI